MLGRLNPLKTLHMTYHVGICEASDIYEDRHYGDCRLVVIWQSEKGAVFDAGLGGVIPRGVTMKIFGASVIDMEFVFSKEAITKASRDELLSMADVAVDHAYQQARQRALRNVAFWKRWWLGQKVDTIWLGQK
jgi:hypothetical protein